MDSSRAHQLYLLGFSGGDLKPARALMCEAYVNGVDGAFVDDMALCKIGGFNPGDEEKARIQRHKLFESNAPAMVERFAKEREYVRELQARNSVESEWSAAEIQRRLRFNVMMAQGQIPYDQLVTASYKGMIRTTTVRAAEVNIPAATAALHLLGKNQGMFKDQVEFKDKTVEAILEELDGGTAGIPNKQTGP